MQIHILRLQQNERKINHKSELSDFISKELLDPITKEKGKMFSFVRIHLANINNKCCN